MTSLPAIGRFLHARAENLLAAMLAVMFVAFIIQIAFRYILNFPVGWTNEVSVVMWIWLVLFGAAFVVRDSEEIRFDILYGNVGSRIRRVIVVITAVACIFFFAASLPAVIDFVTFMQVTSTAYLDIRFDYLYSIYVAFALAVIIRQLWLAIRALRGKDSIEFDVTKAGSGV